MTRQLPSTHAVIRDDRYRFVSRIVDNGQAFQRASTCCSIKDKIYRPDLVKQTWAPKRMPLRQVSLLAPTPLHLQPVKPIQPFQPACSSRTAHVDAASGKSSQRHSDDDAGQARRSMCAAPFSDRVVVDNAAPSRSYESPRAPGVATIPSSASTVP